MNSTAFLHQHQLFQEYNPQFFINNIFFVLTFVMFTNILRKISNHSDLITRLDTLYLSLEYQTATLNRHKTSQENNTDIMKDSIKELKSDIRNVQKNYEQLFTKMSNLQYECKDLQNNLYDDIKQFEDRQKEDRDEIKQDIDYYKEKISYLETSLQSLKNDFAVMYRDVKDDVSRLSK